jgi:hypothetical protein
VHGVLLPDQSPERCFLTYRRYVTKGNYKILP